MNASECIFIQLTYGFKEEECVLMGRGGDFCHSHPLGDVPGESKTSGLYTVYRLTYQ